MFENLLTFEDGSSLDIINNKMNTKLVFIDFKERFNNRIKLKLTEKDIKKLIDILELVCNKKIESKRNNKRYTEEISTYRKEVERTLLITNSIDNNLVLYLDAYTDKEFDDNYIELTDNKVAKLINILYGYISFNDLK